MPYALCPMPSRTSYESSKGYSFFSSSLCTPSPTKINDELSTHLLTTLANCEGKNAI